jgi:hypothetical protein
MTDIDAASGRYAYFSFLNRQCFVKSAASLALQSPFGFSFMSSHHFALPISGAQPDRALIINKALSAG